MERNLMKGNEALAEAAIRAGCKCFFGYPITPQTEISAYMAKRMPKVGGVFLENCGGLRIECGGYRLKRGVALFAREKGKRAGCFSRTEADAFYVFMHVCHCVLPDVSNRLGMGAIR